jgi:hypothetical protein
MSGYNKEIAMNISAIHLSQPSQLVALKIKGESWGVIDSKELPQVATSSFDLHHITANEMRSLNINLYEDGLISRNEFEHACIQYSFARGIDQLNKLSAEQEGRPYESTLGSRKFDLISLMRNGVAYDEQDGQMHSAQLKRGLLAAYEKLSREPGLRVSTLA